MHQTIVRLGPSIPTRTHYIHANIPKSDILVPSISDEGYSFCMWLVVTLMNSGKLQARNSGLGHWEWRRRGDKTKKGKKWQGRNWCEPNTGKWGQWCLACLHVLPWVSGQLGQMYTKGFRGSVLYYRLNLWPEFGIHFIIIWRYTIPFIFISFILFLHLFISFILFLYLIILFILF